MEGQLPFCLPSHPISLHPPLLALAGGGAEPGLPPPGPWMDGPMGVAGGAVQDSFLLFPTCSTPLSLFLETGLLPLASLGGGVVAEL